jgi:hypothetical protein
MQAGAGPARAAHWLCCMTQTAECGVQHVGPLWMGAMAVQQCGVQHVGSLWMGAMAVQAGGITTAVGPA